MLHIHRTGYIVFIQMYLSHTRTIAGHQNFFSSISIIFFVRRMRKHKHITLEWKMRKLIPFGGRLPVYRPWHATITAIVPLTQKLVWPVSTHVCAVRVCIVCYYCYYPSAAEGLFPYITNCAEICGWRSNSMNREPFQFVSFSLLFSSVPWIKLYVSFIFVCFRFQVGTPIIITRRW